MRARFQFGLLETGDLDVVSAEELAEFLRGAEKAVAIPLHDRFGRRRRRRRAWVWVDAAAKEEDEDEEARESGRTKREVARG